MKHHEAMAPILQLLHQFEEPVKTRLKQQNPGRLMFNFCLCVHKDLGHSEQVKMCHLIESNVLKVARNNGFAGVVTNNTNPATQVDCNNILSVDLFLSANKWLSPSNSVHFVCRAFWLNFAQTNCHIICLQKQISLHFIVILSFSQDICEHFFDYKLLSKYLVRDFEFNGRKVFSHAPEDYYLKMMVKFIS